MAELVAPDGIIRMYKRWRNDGVQGTRDVYCSFGSGTIENWTGLVGGMGRSVVVANGAEVATSADVQLLNLLPEGTWDALVGVGLWTGVEFLFDDAEIVSAAIDVIIPATTQGRILQVNGNPVPASPGEIVSLTIMCWEANGTQGTFRLDIISDEISGGSPDFIIPASGTVEVHIEFTMPNSDVYFELLLFEVSRSVADSSSGQIYWPLDVSPTISGELGDTSQIPPWNSPLFVYQYPIYFPLVGGETLGTTPFSAAFMVPWRNTGSAVMNGWCEVKVWWPGGGYWVGESSINSAAPGELMQIPLPVVDMDVAGSYIVTIELREGDWFGELLAEASMTLFVGA